MKTNRDFLVEALTTYADMVMRRSFCWHSLNTHVFITDISELKVILEIVFTQSKTRYLRSSRRMGMNKVIEKLDKQLGIKKKYKVDIKFKEVQNTKAWSVIAQSENIEYGDCYVKYLIPRDLYNKLEALAKIDKESITELSKIDEIFIRNIVV